MDYYVCMRAGTPSKFPDNRVGTCSDCGHAIIFRPYAPPGIPKICVACVLDRIIGGNA